MTSTKVDYDAIMSDRKLFNEFVYTPLSEALKLLEERQKDPILMAKVEKLLKNNVLEPIKNNNRCAVLLRQLATPNHEIQLFVSISKDNKLHPIICEYSDDKFTSNNNYKHSLGQLITQEKKLNKKSEFITEKLTIIDFNKYNGKKIKNVFTLWGESLISFHHKLFNDHFNNEIITVWDGSDLYREKSMNNNVSEHYQNLFLFFVCNAILFENFLTSKDEEGNFTKKILLPTIEKIIKLTGVKPLIVPIPPMDMETEPFWYHYLSKVKNKIPKI